MRTKKAHAALSPRGQLVRKSEADIRSYAKSPEAKASSERLRIRGPEPRERDLAEIPELTDKELAMFRPVKKPVSVRLDADVLAWLKAQGSGYQSRMNAILRKAMAQSRGR